MKGASRCLLALLAGVLLTACAERASGPIERQARDVGAFTAIELRGAAELDVTVGDGPSVEVAAPLDVLDRVKTEVRGETLYIETKARNWLFGKSGKTEVKVFAPTLASLRIEGGNDVVVRGFAGGEADIRAEGAVNIDAEGELDRLTIRMAGAGSGDFSRLVARDTHVTVDGVGNVLVHPKEKLDATMNGVGTIRYTGTPREVRTSMNGLGRIAKTDADAPANPPDEQVEIDPDTLQPEYKNDEPKSSGQVI